MHVLNFPRNRFLNKTIILGQISGFPLELQLVWVEHKFLFLATECFDKHFFSAFKFKLENKCRANVWLRFNCDYTSKLLNYLLGYHKSKPDSINVHLPRVLHKSKQLKELFLILLTDAYASVNNRDLKNAGNLFGPNVHSTLLCELKGIWLNPKENLHNPLFITVDVRARKSNEFGCKFKTLIQSLLSLDWHHFFNHLFDVECLVNFSEFLRFNLCKVKQVLNHEAHYTSWGLLDFMAFK